MDEWKKYGQVEKGLDPASEMTAVNRFTLRALAEEDVFLFRVVACDDQTDREFEQFSEKALQQLAKLYVGKTMLTDHRWSVAGQNARIYAAAVEERGGAKCLVLCAYMLRGDANDDTISAIEGGILKEVSVGCATERAVCSICGTDKRQVYCGHCRGMTYDNKLCTVTLDNATDAYEVSFVAVPAQPGAGVVKRYGGEDNVPAVAAVPPALENTETAKALALLELEYSRY